MTQGRNADSRDDCGRHTAEDAKTKNELPVFGALCEQYVGSEAGDGSANQEQTGAIAIKQRSYLNPKEQGQEGKNRRDPAKVTDTAA